MATTIDPVCGMTIEKGRAADRADFGDTTYYFCSKHCGDRFRTSPEKFLAKTAVKVTEGNCCGGKSSCCGGQQQVHEVSLITHATDAVYICPMHPEVRQVGPGSCPKCGMALENDEVRFAA